MIKRYNFLLSAPSSRSHAASWLSLTSRHRVNNTCNRVKGRPWRWLIYTLHYLSLRNMLDVFRSNHHCSWKSHKFHRKTTCVGVSFFLKMMKLYKDICSALISRTSADFFLIDWRHKRLKIQQIYYCFTENIFGKWFTKSSKKETFISQNISLYMGHRHFEVLWSFILYIL